MGNNYLIAVVVVVIMSTVGGYYLGYLQASTENKEKYRGIIQCDKYGNWFIDKFDVFGLTIKEVEYFTANMCRYKIT